MDSSDEDMDNAENITAESRFKQESESRSDNGNGQEDENEFDNHLMFSSTRYELYPPELKLELVKKAREVNTRKVLSYKAGFKHLNWSKIKIPGYTEEQLKDCLKEILDAVPRIRTMDEMMVDYVNNPLKYNMKTHPGVPKMPVNAMMRYIDDNRAKIVKKMKRNLEPGAKINLNLVSSFGKKMYSELPDKEKKPYIDEYLKNVEEYKRAKKAFLAQYPEFVRKRKVKVYKEKPLKETKRSKPPKEPKTPGFLTPFLMFRESLKKEGQDVPYHDAQAIYKNLSDEDKMKYIRELLNLNTPVEKRFSMDERRIIKWSSGLPKRPLSAYNMFMQDLYRSTAQGDAKQKEFMSQGAKIWKELDDKKKEWYMNQYKTQHDKWYKEMEEWIKKQPQEQHAELYLKYNMLTRKRKEVINDDEVLSNAKKIKTEKASKPAVEIKVEKTKKESVINVTSIEEPVVSTKKKASESSATKAKKPKSSETVASVPENENGKSPKKKASNTSVVKEEVADELGKVKVISCEIIPSASESESGKSPKKRKFKNFIESLGPYPSLSTAHYYMTKRYKGKFTKINKYYTRLSREEKREMTTDMKSYKAQYFNKLQEYMKQYPGYLEKIKEFHAKNRQEQEENTQWHHDNSTDIENKHDTSDSDSSTDSDSS